MKPIERIEQIIAHYNTNIRSFEQEIGVSNNSIGAAIRRKTSVKDETLNNVLNRYSEINPEWLLTGEGQMIRSDKKNNTRELEPYFERLENLMARVIVDVGDVKKALRKGSKNN